MTESSVAGPLVRVAGPDDRDVVVATVVAAFRNDPAFQYFFPDPKRYDHEAAVFAAYLFDKRVAKQLVWVAENCEAVAMWDNPSSAADWENEGDDPLYLEAVERMGSAAERIEIYDGPVEAFLPSTPYWYLGILACHPDHAGQGLARRVSREGLNSASATGVDSYLETTNPSNLGIYERAGWEIVHEANHIPDVPIWVLRHRPQ